VPGLCIVRYEYLYGGVSRDIHGCISSVGALGQWELFEDMLVSVGCDMVDEGWQ